MISGEPYIASGKELFEERQHAKRLVHKLNNLDPDDLEMRASIVSDLFGKTGENCYIEPPFRCDYGYNIFVGDNFLHEL